MDWILLYIKTCLLHYLLSMYLETPTVSITKHWHNLAFYEECDVDSDTERF